MDRSDRYRRFAKERLEIRRLGRFLSILFVCQIPPSLGHFLQHLLVPWILGLLNQAITLLRKDPDFPDLHRL